MQRQPRSGRIVRAWWTISLAASLASSGLAQTSHAIQQPDAQDTQPRAAVLHALFVLRIAPYLTQDGAAEPAPSADPKKPPRPYRIGLVGKDDIATVAPRHLTDKKVGARPTATVVVPLEKAITAAAKDDYDLLYIAASVDTAALQKILASHAAVPVPIVSTRPGFVALGGGVQLFVQDNGVRFEVNAEVMKRQGLHVDSQLQKLSKRGPR